MSARNTRKKKTGKQRLSVKASPLARTLASYEQSKRLEAIAAAMKQSQRRAAKAAHLRDSRAERPASALERTVKEAKRDRKKRVITEALQHGRRGE